MLPGSYSDALHASWYVLGNVLEHTYGFDWEDNSLFLTNREYNITIDLEHLPLDSADEDEYDAYYSTYYRIKDVIEQSR